MSEWDKHWKEQQKKILSTKLEQVINNDQVYHLLKYALLKSEIFKKKKKLKVLEAGCGTGLRSLALVKEFEEISFNITFLDLSKESLDLIRSFIQEKHLDKKARFSFILGNLLHLPFRNEKFDVVWNGGVMEHFKGENRQRIFTEIYKVCDKGGIYISLVPNYLNIFTVLRQKYRERKGTWEYGYQRNFTIFELRKRMKSCQFTILNENGIGSFDPFLVPIVHILKLLKKSKYRSPAEQKTPPRRSTKSRIKKLRDKIEAKLGLGKFLGRLIVICGRK